ncbi:MAG TPA: DUF4926 domain-containing protein [Puia sp.]|nr:DUF4926 domain-containing protein [Puia sp.]
MFNLYDNVIASGDIENIPKGTRGIIVDVLSSRTAYYVEFFEQESNNTLAVVIVEEKDIKLKNIRDLRSDSIPLPLE